MKINVVGTSGSGKSTVSKQLAEFYSVPYIELDALFWRKDWTSASNDEFIQIIESTLNKHSEIGYVIDGNYKRTEPVKWRNIDWVVWVDYGFIRTLYQAVCRAFTRAYYGNELWPGTAFFLGFNRILDNNNLLSKSTTLSRHNERSKVFSY
eukprot:gene5500-6852_t